MVNLDSSKPWLGLLGVTSIQTNSTAWGWSSLKYERSGFGVVVRRKLPKRGLAMMHIPMDFHMYKNVLDNNIATRTGRTAMAECSRPPSNRSWKNG